jgi:hypothetical protein
VRRSLEHIARVRCELVSAHGSVPLRTKVCGCTCTVHARARAFKCRRLFRTALCGIQAAERDAKHQREEAAAAARSVAETVDVPMAQTDEPAAALGDRVKGAKTPARKPKGASAKENVGNGQQGICNTCFTHTCVPSPDPACTACKPHSSARIDLPPHLQT